MHVKLNYKRQPYSKYFIPWYHKFSYINFNKRYMLPFLWKLKGNIYSKIRARSYTFIFIALNDPILQYAYHMNQKLLLLLFYASLLLGNTNLPLWSRFTCFCSKVKSSCLIRFQNLNMKYEEEKWGQICLVKGSPNCFRILLEK